MANNVGIRFETCTGTKRKYAHSELIKTKGMLEQLMLLSDLFHKQLN